MRRENFFRSLWLVGVALVMAAMAVAVSSSLHTLGLPEPRAADAVGWGGFSGGAKLVAQTYWGYALWTFVQQFLLQGFFLLRLLRLLPGPRSAAFVAAGMFALAHLPNPILTVVTFFWGFAACMLFLRYRNLHTLSMAHAIFGIALAIAVPGPVIRNMRVGLGYLTYGHRYTVPLPQPQRPDRIH
jgi:membrane protease YdiL (CAAX protease family)